ncbi:methyltransferase domain-containing protein [Alkalilimnicola ehrlichii MLHE-1]|uniref:methyltransferase domain-containing protein n=1 Tax=Alkalilimnicola ehrlichii TaxID=351052 RepID=UPI0002E9410F|nr:methyltransferase domain-containing protein [Alkalilimnicola ehrlichii]
MDSLVQWFQTPAGRELAGIERSVLDERIQRSAPHGPRARVVRVGGSWLGDGLFMALPASDCWALDWEPTAGADACTDLEQLPLRKESVDLLLLAHALDCSADPASLIREAVEVLAPEGELWVLGFNAWSTWGLRHLRARPVMRRRGLGPGLLTLLLARHGLECRHQAYHGLKAPWPRAGTRVRARNGWERRLAPWLAGVHLLQARKRRPAPIDMKQVWQTPPVEVPGRLVQPTPRTRIHVHHRQI